MRCAACTRSRPPRSTRSSGALTAPAQLPLEACSAPLPCGFSFSMAAGVTVVTLDVATASGDTILVPQPHGARNTSVGVRCRGQRRRPAQSCAEHWQCWRCLPCASGRGSACVSASYLPHRPARISRVGQRTSAPSPQPVAVTLVRVRLSLISPSLPCPLVQTRWPQEGLRAPDHRLRRPRRRQQDWHHLNPPISTIACTRVVVVETWPPPTTWTASCSVLSGAAAHGHSARLDASVRCGPAHLSVTCWRT